LHELKYSSEVLKHGQSYQRIKSAKQIKHEKIQALSFSFQSDIVLLTSNSTHLDIFLINYQYLILN